MKELIRKQVLALRKEIPDETLRGNSVKITDKVLFHPEYQKAELVFAYVDAKGEVKTDGIIQHAWANGKKVAVPKVHGDIMKFYQITSYDDLEEGYFGIMEPKVSCTEVTEIAENCVVIMPGVAFDKKGNRIGYGKGYYDKYFGKYPELYKIAIAFSLQIVEAIEEDEFDVKADCVITE